MNQDIFFELGTEELPSALVKTLAKDLLTDILKAFDVVNLHHGESHWYATPRRIAFLIKDVPLKQDDRQVLKKGPAAQAAHNAEGLPTPALLGFARSLGVDVKDLVLETQEKGAWWVYTLTEPGLETKEWLPKIINECLTKLPIPKPMRWGSQTETFARPVHWAILLQGQDLIETNILGVATAKYSYGHRFMHPQAVKIASADDYVSSLSQAFVQVDFHQRRQMIVEQIEAIAEQNSFYIPMPDDLLDEITSINEWPTVMLADFDQSFLEVPSEVLTASMQGHQKCLSVYDKNHTLLPHFIVVTNLISQKPDAIRFGNEKVMRARLSDAAFFFEQDRKKALIDYAPATEKVVFEKTLGTLAAKTERVNKIVDFLATALNLDKAQALRAVELSKCDLMTGLVNEFPELQGIIGQHYARMDNESMTVSKAMFEQYLPRYSGDELPQTDIGFVLSLADRLDTLVGIFAAGLKPTGEKDPYKLRRHALAIVRMLTSKPNTLDLDELLERAAQNFAFLNLQPALLEEVKQFIVERTKNYFQQHDYTHDMINATLMVQNKDWYDLSVRLDSYKAFLQNENAQILLQSAKRVRQILGQQSDLKEHFDFNVLVEPAEKELFYSVEKIQESLRHMIDTKHYQEAFQQLVGLAKPLESFFEHVFVMAEDQNLRLQRLLLLSKIYQQLQSIVAIGA